MDINARDMVVEFVEGADWSESRLISFHQQLTSFTPRTPHETAWKLLGQAKIYQISRSPQAISDLARAAELAAELKDQKLLELCEFEYLLNHISLAPLDAKFKGKYYLEATKGDDKRNKRKAIWLKFVQYEGRHQPDELAHLREQFQLLGDKIGVAHVILRSEVPFDVYFFERTVPATHFAIEGWLYCRTHQITPLYLRAVSNLLDDIARCVEIDIETVEAFYRDLKFDEKHTVIQQNGVWCTVFENLALAYSLRGHFELAEYWFDRALKHAQKYATEGFQVGMLSEIAAHYARKGDAEATLKWSIQYGDLRNKCTSTDADLILANNQQAHLIELSRLRESEMLRRTEQLETQVAQRTSRLLNEIERRKKAEEEAYQIAFRSSVTGLRNRNWIIKHIDQVIDAQQDFSACYIDLNGFKQINDRYSHAVGDDILRESARRIKNACHPSNIAVHLSGDEFVVLAPGHKADRLLKCASRIYQAFQTPMKCSRRRIAVGLSMGISSGRYHKGSKLAFLESILKEADIAMYSAKSAVGESIVQFNEDLASRLRIEQLFLSEFETQLDNNALEFYCQPQMDLKKGEVNGGELLVRWPHSEMGMIYPDQFIHLIKQRKHFDQLVMQSLPILASLQALHPALKFSINLTAAQLASIEFMNRFIAACASHGISSERLTIELTESDLLDGESDAIDLMYRAKQHGFSFALDDIGKGHNSLLVFSQFPFDYIKIDRQLAQSAPTSKSAQAVIRGLVATCHSLGIKTVIEGVETEEELAFAISVGIDSLQGFLFSTPLPIGEAFNEFVNSRKLAR